MEAVVIMGFGLDEVNRGDRVGRIKRVSDGGECEYECECECGK